MPDFASRLDSSDLESVSVSGTFKGGCLIPVVERPAVVDDYLGAGVDEVESVNVPALGSLGEIVVVVVCIAVEDQVVLSLR